MTTVVGESGFAASDAALHAAAIAEVGFDDFGDDRYLEPLRVLLPRV